MFNKIKKTIVVIFCCFFQDAQGYYTREQLENYFGKPVFSYQHMIDLIVVDQWLYTTELSKILLVGDNVFFDYMKTTPVVGCIFGVAEPIFKNRFSDTRFESFIKNVGNSSQQELQEAIKDALLLSSASTQAYSIHKLLDSLIEVLQDKIIFIKYQIKHDFKCDQKSLRSMKKSLACTAVLIAFVAVTNKFCSSDDKKVKDTVSNIEGLNAFAGLCLFPASYKALKDGYKVLTTDPNVYNKYLDEFQKLLTFVQELKIELKTNGAISFKLANGRIATLNVQDTFLGSVAGLILDLDN